ncbi:hypothetical protein J2T13_003223 [Paenibacillus sp. DS2015]|uniref:hypothetical protein n=1 Tax=Paenibacillus sp. DS2015 TaxID=3373917 RepID=UPI003D19A41A
MTQLIIGVFTTKQDVSLAIQNLKEWGIDEKRDISVLSQDIRELNVVSEDVGTKEPQAGLGNSGLLSGVKDLASDLDIVPHEIAVSGPAASKLAGASMGADTDDFVVRLMDIGIPNKDAQKYEDCLLQGNIILLITGDSVITEEVESILISHHSLPI